MRLRPYTNVELFQEICKIVELPNILDYSLATNVYYFYKGLAGKIKVHFQGLD